MGAAVKYNLLCNVCHEGTLVEGTYSIHLHSKANKQWFRVQDLRVEEIMPQMMFLSESYIQIWERC